MKYFYLLYRSTPSRRLMNEEVENLLKVARRENQLRDVTGMLVCFPDMYVQLIEGDEDIIRQLYLNLTNDARHHRIIILKEGYASERFFPQWSMGYDKQNIAIKDSEDDFYFLDEKILDFFKIIDERL